MEHRSSLVERGGTASYLVLLNLVEPSGTAGSPAPLLTVVVADVTGDASSVRPAILAASATPHPTCYVLGAIAPAFKMPVARNPRVIPLVRSQSAAFRIALVLVFHIPPSPVIAVAFSFFCDAMSMLPSTRIDFCSTRDWITWLNRSARIRHSFF